MTIGVVYRAEAANFARNVRLFQKWTTAARGYASRVLSAADRMSAIAVNGTPANALKTSLAITLTSGQFHTQVVRLDTAVGLDVFFKGVKDGSPVACASYTAASSADTLLVGQAESAGASLVGIAAIVVAENTAVSDANITAWQAQVAASNNWAFPGGGTTHVWDASAIGGGVWTDSVGGVTLTSSGSPTTNIYLSPVFA